MTETQKSTLLFVISLSTALIAILVPVFTYREAINLNAYKIEEMRIDRVIVWEKQYVLDEKQSKILQELKELTIKMEARQ